MERGTFRILGLLGEDPVGASWPALASLGEPLPLADRPPEEASRLLARGLGLALDEIERRFGPEAADREWAQRHRLTLSHPLAAVPVLGSMLRVGPVSLPGDRHAILANGARNAQDLDVDSVPVMRTIFDLGDPSRSRFVLAGGQSGHPLSPWFVDQFPLWARGENLALLATRDRTRVDQGSASEATGGGRPSNMLKLVLRPAPAGSP